MLTPYDVLRMKRSLGIDSSEFLEQYTLRLQNAEQKFPIVILKMEEQSKRCPFLNEKGCGIYRRPSVGLPHVPAGPGRAEIADA